MLTYLFTLLFYKINPRFHKQGNTHTQMLAYFSITRKEENYKVEEKSIIMLKNSPTLPRKEVIVLRESRMFFIFLFIFILQY